MTDRTLRTSADLGTLDLADDKALLPVVAQDAADGRVLMVAWATRQALELSLETGFMHFWSRSRGALWKKGETSGNTLQVVSLHADCDGDTVLARVKPAGPACHTGEATCFGEDAEPGEGTTTPAHRISRRADDDTDDPPARSVDETLAALDAVLAQRQSQRPEGSYTVRLLDDENLRLKKLGEESAELVTALAKADPERIPQEAADLIYHILAALRGAGVPLDQVTQALEERRGER